MSSETVYIIQAEDTPYIKIGLTYQASVIPRLKNLQTGCPLELKLLATTQKFTEAELHQAFRDYRVRGEWFWCRDRLESFVNNLIRLQYKHPERYKPRFDGTYDKFCAERFEQVIESN